ncbi:SemiSWEET transporter [Amphritea pacifica]|uniref:SemiSWEET transporter n=1 Tax=Amphritea pacifica TaxID=2811233 RepID=A0ABS2W723_9GAMM|nr:SemiSWEET transporter [Amphritea pacifica]MBN0987513.1 SemiSWEET transporter [Amphritea pacifica]MBN1005164.1 SemiSWEET transporter [Amphritea pacifica]
MDNFTLIGLMAATCTTLSFVPQVVHILRTGNVEGISLMMYSVFTVGVALWLTYGLLLGDLPVILANLVTLVLASTVLVLTLIKRYRIKRDHPAL